MVFQIHSFYHLYKKAIFLIWKEFHIIETMINYRRPFHIYPKSAYKFTNILLIPKPFESLNFNFNDGLMSVNDS